MAEVWKDSMISSAMSAWYASPPPMHGQGGMTRAANWNCTSRTTLLYRSLVGGELRCAHQAVVSGAGRCSIDVVSPPACRSTPAAGILTFIKSAPPAAEFPPCERWHGGALCEAEAIVFRPLNPKPFHSNLGVLAQKAWCLLQGGRHVCVGAGGTLRQHFLFSLSFKTAQ